MSIHTERELKARLDGPIDAVRRRLVEAGWVMALEGEMSDRILDTPDGRLFGADEVLRVRTITSSSGDTGTVLTWKGPTRYENGFKVRDELELEAGEPGAALALFARLGFSVVVLAIDRRIAVFETEAVHVRIEQYPDMDTLIEIEGDPDAIERRIAEVGLPRSSWVTWRLEEFVESFEARTGRLAMLASA